MAEFLLRGYNVAMPEVDIGDDIFVVHDQEGRLWRIQVKTAVGKRRGYGYSGKFAVRWDQLGTARQPDLFYVFALRAGKQWEFLLIKRRELQDLQNERRLATRSGNNLIFALRFTSDAVRCSQTDLQPYRANWSEWPVIAD
jgi:hypothetical protein